MVDGEWNCGIVEEGDVEESVEENDDPRGILSE